MAYTGIFPYCSIVSGTTLDGGEINFDLSLHQLHTLEDIFLQFVNFESSTNIEGFVVDSEEDPEDSQYILYHCIADISAISPYVYTLNVNLVTLDDDSNTSPQTLQRTGIITNSPELNLLEVNVSQQGASYLIQLQTTYIASSTFVYDTGDSELVVEYFTDEDLTNKIGEASPPVTQIYYDSGNSDDYSLWAKVVTPTGTLTVEIPVEIVDYKPQFTFVNYDCKPMGEEVDIRLASLVLNELGSCEDDLQQYVQWKVYFHDELEDTQTIEFPGDIDPESIDLNDYKLNYTFTNVGRYLITCSVQNCNGFTTKQFTLTVCGPLKFRKMDCTHYRLYNPRIISSDNFIVRNMEGEEVLAGTILPFSYVNIYLPDQGIYTLECEDITQYIINWCDLDACYTDIINKYLCEDCNCKGTKNSKYEAKVNRITALYEVYKKITDVFWIYQINYNNVDLEETIASMYEANELAKKILELCESCKPCGCK